MECGSGSDWNSEMRLAVVREKGAGGIKHPCRARLCDVKTAVRKRTVIAWRHEQIFSPVAAIGAREPDVNDPRKSHVVDGAQSLRRLFNRHGALCQIHHGQEIDGVGVGSQEQ